jgi:hypothetical protein
VPIAEFGFAISPADNTDPGAATSVSVTPPANMVAGQLAVLVGHSRSAQNTNPLILTEAGGQTWFRHDTQGQSSNSHHRILWCKFNGTWTADPVMSCASGTALQLFLGVWDPEDADLDWALDVERTGQGYTAPASPFDVTQAGITTTADNVLVLVVFGSVDDNTWALQTAGWSQPGGVSHWRNLAGSDQSLSIAYKVQATAGPTGDVTNRQATLGGDTGTTSIVAFRNDLIFARRAPTSDEAVSGTWTGSAGTRYQSVDDHQDWSEADVLTHGTTAGNITFGFSALSVPPDAAIRRVMVRWIDKKNGTGAANIQCRIKVGGNYYAQGSYNPINAALENRLEVWANNPKSGVAWTPDDLNGVGPNALEAFGLLSSDANPTIVIPSIELEVEYAIGFPYVVTADTKSGAVNSDSNSWSPEWPSNLEAGDQVVLVAAPDGGPTPTLPDGWVWTWHGSGTDARVIVAWYVAQGGESGTFTLSLSAAEQGVWRTFRVKNGRVEFGASATGTSATADPPNLDPPILAKEKVLWLAICAASADFSINSYPSGYSKAAHDTSTGGASSAEMGTAWRPAEVLAEDPASFGLSGSVIWRAVTYAIRPAHDGAGLRPDDVAGLTMWLAADETLGNLADDTPVDSWPNIARNPGPFVGTSTARPLLKTNLVNAKPAVRFDGSNDELTFDNVNPVLGYAGNGCTLIAVMQARGAGPIDDRDIVFQPRTSDADRAWFSTREDVSGVGDVALFDVRSTPNHDGADALTVPDDQFVIVAWRVDHAADATAFRVNGDEQVVSSFPSAVSAETAGVVDYRIGSRIAPSAAQDNYSRIDIAELAFYNRELTDAELDGVVEYLNAKYDVYEAEAVEGAADVTLPALTATGTAQVEVAGSAAAVLPELGAEASGSVAIDGSSAGVLPALESQAEAVVAVQGESDGLMPALEASASGAVAVQGQADEALPALESESEGTVGAGAEAEAFLPALIAVASGVVVVSGTVTADLPALAATAVGSVDVSGSAAVTLPGLESTATVGVAVTGEVDGDLPVLAGSSLGTVQVGGSASALLPALSTTSTGLVGESLKAAVIGAVQIGPRVGMEVRVSGRVGMSPEVGPRVLMEVLVE